ncbi:MAG TPA: RHS repeat-associated core domain-containing protein [Gemmatimonadaceae bacterium]
MPQRAHRWSPRRCCAALIAICLLALASPVRAQTTDVTPPQITITPDGGSYFTSSVAVPVTIEWCDTESKLAPTSRLILLNGVSVTSGFSYTTGAKSGCFSYAVSRDTLTFTEGGWTLEASISDLASNSGRRLVGYTVTVPKHAIAVQPVQRFVTTSAGTATTQSFTVRNLGNVDDTYTFAARCTGAALTARCIAPAAQTITAGAAVTVAVSDSTAGRDARGTVVLIASLQGNPMVADSAWVEVTTTPKRVPGIVASELNPGAAEERQLCMNVSVAPAAALECGDLLLAHALPTIRTINKDRAPTLLYNSRTAHPAPAVAAEVTIGSVVPESIEVVLKRSDGSTLASRRLGGAAWLANGTRRVTVAFDGIALATGVYHYTAEARTLSSGVWNLLGTDQGVFTVVNRSQTATAPDPFHAGWWLAGLERLLPLAGDTLLWVGGDGSTRIYLRAGTSQVWRAPNLTVADSITSSAAGYERWLSLGAHVTFDPQGRHIQTTSRIGHVTSIAYTRAGSDTIATLTVPTADGSGRVYRFEYDGQGLLQVVAPPLDAQQRIVRVARSGATLTFTDPDTTSVAFTYGAGWSNFIVARQNRRQVTTIFTPDDVGRLRQVTIDPDSLRITTTICAAESRGATTCQPGSVAIDSVLTWIDGPRSVNDTVRFWVNRYGAPTRIRDAAGADTRIAYDFAWPGLPHRTESPTGFSQLTGYNARGLADSVVAIDPYADRRDAVTHYTWDTALDVVRQVVLPEGEQTSFTYDAYGNLRTRLAGTDPARTVEFHYGSPLKLVTSVWAGGVLADSVTYDTVLGNARDTRTALGRWTRTERDALGRARVLTAPVRGDTVRTDSTEYDLADQVTRSVAVGLAVDGGPAQRLVVRTSYDPEGNTLSVTRADSSAADTTRIGAITTSWVYDRANRKTIEVAPDLQRDSVAYDSAGNVRAHRTRRGDLIAFTYDGANRLDTQVSPSYQYAKRNEGLAAPIPSPQPDLVGYPYFSNDSQGGYTISTDTARFGYDVAGRLASALNADAQVRRSYFPNGQIQSETLSVRLTQPLSGCQTFGCHVYVTKYRYDRDGRLAVLRYPSQVAPSNGGDSVVFGYHPATGALASVRDLLANQFRYTYNMRDQVDTIVRPGGLADVFTYDDDGALLTARLVNQSSSPSRISAALIRDASFSYRDGDGKLVSSTDPAAWGEQVSFHYSGLGHLIGSAYQWSYTGTDTNVVAMRLTRSYSTSETFRYDALGNAASSLATTTYDSSSTWRYSSAVIPAYEETRSSNGTSTSKSYRYVPGTGRLDTAYYKPNPGSRTDRFVYDANGATVFSSRVRTTKFAPGEDRASFYDANGRLRATDFRSYTGTGDERRRFEEYAYDALGRRVLVRSRGVCTGVTSHPVECNLSMVRRVIWEGNRELGEIQARDTNSTPNPAAMESDADPVIGGWYCNSACEDPNKFYGRVAYTYGLGIDQPLSVTRMGYADDSAGVATRFVPFMIQPLWNTRGEAELGLYADGGAMRCMTAANGSSRCVSAGWPAGWFAYDRASFQPISWHGELVTDKRDGSGLAYRRNRYYEPLTGRFTQEDPIGLAGGLNLYGYASGDPVSYSDPFGLCPWCLAFDLTSSFVVNHPVAAKVVADLIDAETAGFNCASDPSCSAPPPGGSAGALAGKLLMVLPTAHGVGGGAGAAAGLSDDAVVVRGGTSEIPPPGTTFSGAAGSTLEDAAQGVPHGTVRATTAGRIRQTGGSVVPKPEPTRSGVMNNKHVNICLGSGPCPFGDPIPNPVPKSARVQ